MEKYIKSITALNELTLSTPSENEIERFAESDIFWANNKNKSLQHRKVEKGNIYQFEFGKNFIPEMSYEHRGLVIGVSGKLLYVLPICSYKDKYKDVYHPVDNPYSKSNYFLLKGEEFPFLKHDSVLKLNDIRTVSLLRIKYKQENGFISPSSDTYKAIEKVVFAKYFYDYSYKYDRLAEENQRLTEQLTESEQSKQKAEEKIKTIKDLISSHGFDEESLELLKEMLDIN